MDDPRSPQDRLAALGAHLAARRLEVELTDLGLRVTDPHTTGCCDEVATAADTIACHARPEDGGRYWYYTSWREPIAPADQVIDAAVFILGYLGKHLGTRETAQ